MITTTGHSTRSRSRKQYFVLSYFWDDDDDDGDDDDDDDDDHDHGPGPESNTLYFLPATVAWGEALNPICIMPFFVKKIQEDCCGQN